MDMLKYEQEERHRRIVKARLDSEESDTAFSMLVILLSPIIIIGTLAFWEHLPWWAIAILLGSIGGAIHQLREVASRHKA